MADERVHRIAQKLQYYIQSIEFNRELTEEQELTKVELSFLQKIILDFEELKDSLAPLHEKMREINKECIAKDKRAKAVEERFQKERIVKEKILKAVEKKLRKECGGKG